MGADLVPKASARLHDDETRIQYAMSAIVPAVLAGIIHKAGTGDAGKVLAMAKDTANGNVFSDVGSFLSDNSLLEKGTDLLKGIFGGRMNYVVNQVSNFFRDKILFSRIPAEHNSTNRFRRYWRSCQFNKYG